jgi:hypothetical protein
LAYDVTGGTIPSCVSDNHRCEAPVVLSTRLLLVFRYIGGDQKKPSIKVCVLAKPPIKVLTIPTQSKQKIRNKETKPKPQNASKTQKTMREPGAVRGRSPEAGRA